MVCSAVAVGDLPVFYAVIDQTSTLHWPAASCRGAADCVILAPQPPPSRDERHQSIDPYADGHRLSSGDRSRVVAVSLPFIRRNIDEGVSLGDIHRLGKRSLCGFHGTLNWYDVGRLPRIAGIETGRSVLGGWGIARTAGVDHHSVGDAGPQPLFHFTAAETRLCSGTEPVSRRPAHHVWTIQTLSGLLCEAKSPLRQGERTGAAPYPPLTRAAHDDYHAVQLYVFAAD